MEKKANNQKKGSQSILSKKKRSKKQKLSKEPLISLKNFRKRDSEIEKIKEELKKIQESYQYLQAEFANHKRHSIKEREETARYASFIFVREMLINVLNDFTKAIERDWEDKDFSNFKKGMEMIYSQFIKHLQHHGIEEINPLGEVFDPHFHEVLGAEENEEKAENTVLAVCRKGYKMKDRLVQPAGVIVSKKKEGS